MEYLTLEEIKDIELDLLIKFDEFCIKHDLTYSLAYGTLLGAIRHKDFIPWDDDVDVMMPRDDYDKLFSLLCDKDEHITDYISVLTSKNSGYYYHFNKIFNKNTIAKMDNNVTEHGIWLDIFPIDSVPDSDIKAHFFHVKARLLRNIIISATTNFKSKKNNKYYLKLFLKCIANCIGVQKISDYLSKYIQKYNGNECKNVSVIHGQYSTAADLDYKQYFETERKIFREHYFCVSKGWDAILKGMYGDYMEIPDVGKRATHFLKASYKQ